jgi:hypothetical protein
VDPIREAQKHVDPDPDSDPDPQHCFLIILPDGQFPHGNVCRVGILSLHGQESNEGSENAVAVQQLIKEKKKAMT